MSCCVDGDLSLREREFVELILSNCAVDRYGKIGLAFPIIRGSITNQWSDIFEVWAKVS